MKSIQLTSSATAVSRRFKGSRALYPPPVPCAHLLLCIYKTWRRLCEGKTKAGGKAAVTLSPTNRREEGEKRKTFKVELRRRGKEDMDAAMGRKQGRSGEKSNFAVVCSLLSQYIKEKGSVVADLGLGVPPPPLDAPKGKSEAFRPPPTTMMLLPGADVSGGEGEGERTGEEELRVDTMELFPQRAGFGPSSVTALAADGKPGDASDVREPKRAQLTIFYGDKVLVFDSFPSDKVKNLMQLASKVTSTMQNSCYVEPSSSALAAAVVDHPTNLSNQETKFTTSSVSNSVAAHSDLERTAQSDLPIARKSSLQRFLEKRKDRISAKSPYQVTGSSESPAPVKPEDGKPWLGLGQ
ncbi:unnamed protein product [Musa acuminata var. zebrina]